MEKSRRREGENDASRRGQRKPSFSRVLRVFEATEREADRYGHEYIGTEHLLLGLLAEPNGIAGRVLIELGVADAAAVRVREIIASEGYNTPSTRVI